MSADPGIPLLGEREGPAAKPWEGEGGALPKKSNPRILRYPQAARAGAMPSCVALLLSSGSCASTSARSAS